MNLIWTLGMNSAKKKAFVKSIPVLLLVIVFILNEDDSNNPVGL